MKKFLFAALGIGALLFSITYAEESDLSEYLKNSEATLKAEFSGDNNEKNIDEFDIEDERDYRDDDREEKLEDKREFEKHDDEDIRESIDIDKDAIGAVLGFGLMFFGIIFGCRLIGFIFWLRMIIDAARYQKEGRVAWILVLVFFNILGAIIYLCAAKIGRKKEDRLNID